MCNVNVVNRISCFCLIIFFLEEIGGGHPLATPLLAVACIAEPVARC